MSRIRVTGLKELEKKLKDNVTLNDVKKVIKFNGMQLQKRMQEKADFKKGYQTGATKRSITVKLSSTGMTADVRPGTEYAPYLEFGTRFMEAQPFMRPALDEQTPIFKEHMRKLMR